MKRTVIVAFCILTLCLLTCLVSPKLVNAQSAGYTHTCYTLTNAPTIDGKWTSPSEWTDGQRDNFGTNAVFYDGWVLTSYSPVQVDYYLLMETNDSTNDPGDYWQICLDGSMDGGSAPLADDFLINITGHTTATWYEGTGSGWAVISTPSATTFSWNETLSTSPVYSTPHYILEVHIIKTDPAGSQTGIMGAEFWMRVAVNDAHSGGYGLQAWPPTSRDTPSSYGDIPYSSSAVPESLNISLIMVLSAVAVAAGSVILKKRSSITELVSKRKPTL